MKSLLAILMLAMLLTSCGSEEKKSEIDTDTKGIVHTAQPQVEVMYFHGKQRCMTCRAIERVASETVAEKYPTQLANGKIRFSVIDIDSPEGETIADEYHIACSSLLVVTHNADGSEAVADMTDKAFANVRNNPEAFSTILCDAINCQLN